ncbi:MAG: hypothetical protein ACI8ZM_003969 [Crocinitomix sp.]|jgi:hypothetical protein
MKTKIMSLFAVIMLLAFSGEVNAQCTDCLNVNGDFATYTGPIPPGSDKNNWINSNLDNWSVSNGTPTFSPTQMWMWSYYGRGEGVYTDFNFIAGETYTVCYRLFRSFDASTSSVFRVTATNGLTPHASGGPLGTTIPTPPGPSMSLNTQDWLGTGVGVWETITETFVAGANYSQLWFYPYLAGAPSPNQAAVTIDDICIIHIVDPCDFEPRFVATYEEPCNVHFDNVTTVPAGLTVIGVTWDFGDGTTGSGASVDHFYSAGGAYYVCMTVWMVNDEGDCCQKKYCEWVDAPECDPCDWIREARILVTGTNPFTFTVGGLPSGMYSVLGYHWDFGDGTDGTGQTVTHTYATGGGKTVCVTIFYYDPETKECCSAVICTEVEADWVELGDGVEGRGHIDAPLEDDLNYQEGELTTNLENINKIIVSPNPSNGEFEIRFKEGGAIETVNVYDQTGKLVYSIDNTSTNNLLRMNLTELEKGMYMIIVNEANELTRSFDKIVIQ